MKASTDHINRTKKFTNEEFKALVRYNNGDIKDLYSSTAFIWITDSQKELLSEDDTSRVWEYEEEIASMIADFY